jgi:uncharacterized membrane protein
VENKPKRDWFKFWMYFCFGAVFGALVGLRVWFRSKYARDWFPGIMLILGGALVWGFIAGFFSNSRWNEWDE